jgi:hypothetical protein
VRRTLTLLVAAVAALALVWVALLLTRGDDDAISSDPGPPVDVPVAGEDVVEVVVLVDEAADPADVDRAVGLITDATRMWAGGLAGLEDLERGEGATGQPDPRDLVVRTERLATDGEHELVDPEVVFVVAADAEAAGGAVVRVVGRDGTECAAYDDVFALGAWRGRAGFDSHHRLPEGTFDQDCGDPGPDAADACFAVNATFVAGGVDPMEAFGLVGDELGHCLGASAGRAAAPAG